MKALVRKLDQQAAPARRTRSGIEARVETEVLEFEFDSFEAGWEVLAGVTADLPSERQEEAKAAVQAAMWPESHQPRRFRNTTQFITGTRA